MLENFPLISIIDPLSHKYNLYDVILRTVILEFRNYPQGRFFACFHISCMAET